MVIKQEKAVYFGRTNFRGGNRIFGIKVPDRRQHMYVVGKTGTGKTTLIKNLAIQDIQAGRGLCVVDPHGELVEEILSQIPPERAGDIIYFNPADTEYPIGFNVLEAPDKQYKHLVSQGLIGIFTKIWANVWSARMEYILQNCILALIETPGTTLLGIQRILVDKDYRQRILGNVTDPVVKAFWVNEYETWRDQFRNEAIVPIQNKVGQFVSTSLIRNIVGQTRSSFDMFDVMNERKILLANISKGRIGEENSALLGAMLITKVQLASMERVRIPEDERQDFYLYVDEFQNFATEAFASILSEARKYRLDLIIAHQYLGQLVTETTTKVRDAVFGNVGTMVVFRVGAGDAEFLEKEFTPEFTIQDLVCLPNRCVYLKLMVDGVTSRPFSASTLPPLAVTAEKADREAIITASRKQFARTQKDVEEEIMRWSSELPGSEGALSNGGATRKGPSGERFESPCWVCGKTAITPFKPDPHRPLYCTDCLKKIEEGKIRPLRPLPGGRKHQEYAGGLEELGIEFFGKTENKKSEENLRPAHDSLRATSSGGSRPQALRRPVPAVRSGELVTKQPVRETLSLQDLVAEKRTEQPRHRQSAHIKELRKTLKEVLGNLSAAPKNTERDFGETEGPSKTVNKKTPSGIREERDRNQNQNNQNGTLRPGQTVKF